MGRLSTNDERRFKQVAQIHQDILMQFMVMHPDSFDAVDINNMEEAQKIIDAIRVVGDKQREARADVPTYTKDGDRVS